MCTPSSGTWDPSWGRWVALTEVGELHSLTDWQVSEASEDAELEDFCHAEASRCAQTGRSAVQDDGRREDICHCVWQAAEGAS